MDSMRCLAPLGALAVLVAAALPAPAAIEFDQNVTNDVIYGSGNTNGSWSTNRVDGVELGLRAHVRFPVPANVFNSNGDGTYNHAAGNFANNALWNFDWSINTNYTGTTGLEVGELVYELRMDFDPSLGVNLQIFDPINQVFADHSFGNNGTAESAGVEAVDAASYAALLASSNLAQNSWRLDFFETTPLPPWAFNPDADGVYTFELAAYRPGAADPLAEVTIDVIVGAGAGVVPEPMALLTWGGLAICGGGLAWRKRAKLA
jgi:hypothetical protein